MSKPTPANRLEDGRRRTGSVTLDELTEIVFRHTHQTPFTEASEDVLTRIRLSLYQAHLPKLASKGLINYDSERQLVEPIEQGEQVQETLSTIRDADPSLEAPIELYHQTYHYHGDDELEQCFEHLFRPRRRTTEIP